ncbi:hypothetical protein RFI_28738 [Reticulomyxa filosa]|uniref:Uncharacterized protein n=1 Tax=Reticulomyxa filosa TaxID=46433 RepID=X6M3Z3_RETFI|nr:hypothetical protein RFI_28738 [Reticulomyxa filosa]|eukprot:ETO08649.1 hypothetical protein RFI_28738 [Reticulomyxa filosa]
MSNDDSFTIRNISFREIEDKHTYLCYVFLCVNRYKTEQVFQKKVNIIQTNVDVITYVRIVFACMSMFHLISYNYLYYHIQISHQIRICHGQITCSNIYISTFTIYCASSVKCRCFQYMTPSAISSFTKENTQIKNNNTFEKLHFESLIRILRISYINRITKMMFRFRFQQHLLASSYSMIKLHFDLIVDAAWIHICSLIHLFVHAIIVHLFVCSFGRLNCPTFISSQLKSSKAHSQRNKLEKRCKEMLTKYLSFALSLLSSILFLLLRLSPFSVFQKRVVSQVYVFVRDFSVCIVLFCDVGEFGLKIVSLVCNFDSNVSYSSVFRFVCVEILCCLGFIFLF